MSSRSLFLTLSDALGIVQRLSLAKLGPDDFFRLDLIPAQQQPQLLSPTIVHKIGRAHV